MKTKLSITVACLIVLFVPVLLIGQQQSQPPAPAERPYPPNMPNAPNAPNLPNPPNMPNPPMPPPDPLADVMFPPELIMSHARELQLTDAQKVFMRGEIQNATTQFNELQWKLQDEMEALHETLKSNSVNEQQALAQLGKVLDVERQIKLLHVGMGVRMKNRLTPEQQELLRRMRMPPQPDGRPRPM